MKIRICDLCYELDEVKLAVAAYKDKVGDVYDVCEECLVKVKYLKLVWWEKP